MGSTLGLVKLICLLLSIRLFVFMISLFQSVSHCFSQLLTRSSIHSIIHDSIHSLDSCNRNSNIVCVGIIKCSEWFFLLSF